MKVIVERSRERRVEIHTSIDQLAELYGATRPGRRTKRQYEALEAFGDALADAEPALVPLFASMEAATKQSDQGENDEPV